MEHFRKLIIICDNHFKFLKVNVFIHYIGIKLYVLEANLTNHFQKIDDGARLGSE
jgi:hypothetical protein